MQYIESLKKYCDSLVSEIVTLTYFMRGSIQYENVMMLSKYEREKISDFLKERFEIESKKTHPIY